MATRVLGAILALVVMGLAVLPAAPVGALVLFPANITLLPASDSNPVGTNHVLTAKVLDNMGNVFPGAPITWFLSGVGSFVGTPDPTTDQNGEARATITSAGPGQSTVTASVTATLLTATATKDWTADAGPPDKIPSMGQWGIIVAVAGLACSVLLATSRGGRRGATPR